MRNQQLRGNPEAKLVMTRDSFTGGINTIDSDDGMNPKEVRYMKNYDIESNGAALPRKSFLRNTLLGTIFSELGLGTPPQARKSILSASKPYNGSDQTDYVIVSTKLFSRDVYYLEMNFDRNTSTKNYLAKHFTFSLVMHTENNETNEKTTEVLYSFDPVISPELIALRGLAPHNKIAYKFYIPNDINISPDLETHHLSRQLVLRIGLSSEASASNVTLNDLSKVMNIRLSGSLEDYALPSGTQDDIHVVPRSIQVIRNDNNLLERMSDYDTTQDFSREHPDDNSVLEILYSYSLVSGVDGRPLVKYGVIIVTSKNKSFTFTYKDLRYKAKADVYHRDIHNTMFGFSKPLVNIDGHLISNGIETLAGGKIGLMAIPIDHNNVDSKIKLLGHDSATYNDAYKPTPMEVRTIGFNVLGTDPLTWVNASGIVGASIQGVYLTLDGALIQQIPLTSKFRINVMFTGNAMTSSPTIKFFNGVGEDKTEITSVVTKVSDTNGVYIADVQLTTPPSSEVEIEIDTKIETLSKHRDYYTTGDVGTDLRAVEALDTGDARLFLVWDRLVATVKDTIWFSHHTNFTYFPNTNYVSLPISPSDIIQNVIYFRGNYIIFTKEKIFKMSGSFSASTMKIELVSDVFGTISPYSVKVMDNSIIFLSPHGLYALKSGQFVANTENMNKIDEKLMGVTAASYRSFAFTLDNQYIMYTGNSTMYDDLGIKEVVSLPNGAEYPAPDVIRLYKNRDAYVFDNFESGCVPQFLFEYGGRLYTLSDTGLYEWRSPRGVENHTDFESSFEMEVETAASNFSYANHEKKVKQMIVKFGSQSYQQRFDIQIFADGHRVHEVALHPSEVIDVAELEGSRVLVVKLRLPSIKCKNIAFRIKTLTEETTSLNAVSFIYKLGKMRE